MGTFAVKLFLRGVRAAIYLASPNYETVSDWMVRVPTEAIQCVQTNGQPITLTRGEVVSVMGPEPESKESTRLEWQLPAMPPLDAEMLKAMDVAFGYGEGALETLEDEGEISRSARPRASKWIKEVYKHFREADTTERPDRPIGDDEADQENADVWLFTRGDVRRAIGCAGPDYVHSKLGERSFGGETLVLLTDGNPGIINGYSDDGIFTIDGATSPEASNAVTIDGIVRIITFDLEDDYHAQCNSEKAKAHSERMSRAMYIDHLVLLAEAKGGDWDIDELPLIV